MKTRIARVTNPFSAYESDRTQPREVRVTRSKARAAGPNGVTFYAPGWRPMVFREMAAAERKMESHPGFVEWVR